MGKRRIFSKGVNRCERLKSLGKNKRIVEVVGAGVGKRIVVGERNDEEEGKSGTPSSGNRRFGTKNSDSTLMHTGFWGFGQYVHHLKKLENSERINCQAVFVMNVRHVLKIHIF